MNTFSILLINVIILLFPLIIHLFYLTYISNLDQEQNKTFLDFALLSSLYLGITYNEFANLENFSILLNVPLLIAFIKKRNFVSLIMAYIIIFNQYTNLNSLILLTIEYVTYYLIYLVTNKSKQNRILLSSFVLIKAIVLSFSLNLFTVLFILITFVLTINLVIYMLKKGEDIIRLHMSIKELEKEKQIRTSLFKITHEIKNPIAVCKSYLDMFDFNNKDHERYIPIVKEEIEKILLLLQDFLAMNKIKVKKEILDINLLLEEIIDQFAPVLKEKNIDFKYELLDDEIFIEGDYNRLSQVLVNMLKNAIEAVDNNKKSYVAIDCEKSDKFKISIEDNGIGFEDSVDKIKEPFYTTKKNGTGLGVSLSCEIITAHNGTIDYFTKVGKGTKVVIELPLSNMFD